MNTFFDQSAAGTAIWALLLLLAVPAVVVLASPYGVRHPRLTVKQAMTMARRIGEQRRERQAAAEEQVRYAAELHVVAERAHHAADRWQQRWEEAGREVESRWQDWQDAQDRLDRAHGAAAYAKPRTAQSPTEYADRERWMHRAVAEAVERGELGFPAITDAAAGRGWDPRLHPFDQQLAVLRASIAYLGDRYHRAVAAEQAAWHDAQLARRTRDDLGWELADATAHAADLTGGLPTPATTAHTAVKVRAA
ncbi:hypothetical protein [Actinoplanes sp. NPDC051851]|uniref:hypothetical protein n=1 Tax=Actinoplanes sp. NPDC051851 TaxID=3154753 RepID=UPI00342BCB6A